MQLAEGFSDFGATRLFLALLVLAELQHQLTERNSIFALYI